ncbi:MAG TPA: protein tyrosine phosphatase family protein [Gemmatimonadaceae bacterium]
MSDTTFESVLTTIPNGTCPLPGVVAAGQPAPEAWTALQHAGVRTVVDLRPEWEPRGYDEPAAVRAAGLEYVSIPVTHEALGDAEFDAMRELLGDPDRRPIIVHCASSNRVGALLLPYFALDMHEPLDAALQLAKRAGLKSPDLASAAVDYVRRHIAAP